MRSFACHSQVSTYFPARYEVAPVKMPPHAIGIVLIGCRGNCPALDLTNGHFYIKSVPLVVFLVAQVVKPNRSDGSQTQSGRRGQRQSPSGSAAFRWLLLYANSFSLLWALCGCCGSTFAAGGRFWVRMRTVWRAKMGCNSSIEQQRAVSFYADATLNGRDDVSLRSLFD